MSDDNGHTPDPLAHLSAAHLSDLRRSGLTDAVLLAAGVRTVKDANTIQKYLNWNYNAGKLGECLAFPYSLPDGGKTGFVRFRPDSPRVKAGKPIKYESPLGFPLRLYFSPTATAAALADAALPLCVVEGEKKTLRAVQEGFVAIGVAGVWAWQVGREEGQDGKKQGPRRLLPDFDLIVWTGRRVYLIFDSDVATNPISGWGEFHLADLLRLRGADVRVVRLPPGPPGKDGGPEKVGLDDYLLTHTADDLRGLMERALPPGKPEPDTAIEADDDPHRLARLYVEQNRHLGHLDTLRFWREEWHRWTGCAYRLVPSKEIVAKLTQCAKAEFDRLNIEAQIRAKKQKEQEGPGAEDDGKETADAAKAAAKKKKKARMEAAAPVTTRLTADVRQALTDLCLLPSTVDAPAWLCPEDEWGAPDVLACRNGLLHLPSLVADKDHLIPPTPLFFSHNALDYDFDFDAAPCKEWLAFLGKIWPDDPQSIGALQEWFGYTLTPDTSQQKILMMVGPPRSGKGTIARVNRRMIGDANACSPTLSSLAGNFGLQPLLGKMLAVISDARLSRRTDLATITERLLSISGEDGQTVDRKHLPSVDGKLAVRFEILTNELPRLNDASGALVSRMVVLRFTRSWLGKEDVGLTARLLKELPGVLLWAIEGWRRLRDRGCFLQPDSGTPLLRDLENLSSPVGAFVRECCVVADGKTVLFDDATVCISDLFARWKEWCEGKGRKEPGEEPLFGRNLRSAVPHLEVKRPRIPGSDNKGPRHYHGIRLKTPDEMDQSGAGEETE